MNKKTLLGGLGVILALILSVVGLVGNQSDKGEELGRSTGFAQIRAGDEIIFGKRLTLGSGEQFVSFRNTTGRTIYVEDLKLTSHPTTATSTSFVVFAGTSTAATLTGGAGLSVMDGGGLYASGTHSESSAGLVAENLPFGGILDNLIIGSTTVSVSNSTTTTAKASLSKRENESQRTAVDRIKIEPLEYFWLLLVTGDNEQPNNPDGRCNVSAGAALAGNNCESATSTARGLNLEALFEFSATSTLRD